jgi:hypothetical protein
MESANIDEREESIVGEPPSEPEGQNELHQLPDIDERPDGTNVQPSHEDTQQTKTASLTRNERRETMNRKDQEIYIRPYVCHCSEDGE